MTLKDDVKYFLQKTNMSTKEIIDFIQNVRKCRRSVAERIYHQIIAEIMRDK